MIRIAERCVSSAAAVAARKRPTVRPDGRGTEMPLDGRGVLAGARPLSLRRNFAWSALGGCAQGASRWGMVLVLAQLGSLEMLGLVVLAFAVCAPLKELFKLGLRPAMVTDAKHEYRFGHYLALRLATSAMALVIVVATAVLIDCPSELALVIVAVGLAGLFESLSDVFHALQQQYERMDRIALALVIRGPLSLALLAAGVLLTGSAVWGILGFSLAFAVTLLIWDLPNGLGILRASTSAPGSRAAAALKPRWNAAKLLSLARLSLPLGVVAMTVVLIGNIPRYMIAYHLGEATLAVFVAIVYLSLVGTMLINAMGQAASARLAKYYAAENARAFARLLAKLTAVALCLGLSGTVLVALLGKPILHLLYGGKCDGYAGVAVWLMIAAVVAHLNGPLSRAVEAMRRFKTNMVARIAGGLLLLLLLPKLLENYGLKGAAAAMAAGAAAAAAIYAWTVCAEIRRMHHRQIGGVARPATLSG